MSQQLAAAVRWVTAARLVTLVHLAAAEPLVKSLRLAAAAWRVKLHLAAAEPLVRWLRLVAAARRVRAALQEQADRPASRKPAWAGWLQLVAADLQAPRRPLSSIRSQSSKSPSCARASIARRAISHGVRVFAGTARAAA